MAEDPLIVATELDAAHAIRNALNHVDATFEQLAEMHRTGHYDSIRHRIAWAAIGNYYQDRHYYEKLLETE
ncbi:hypothetical protein ACFYY5_29415 [Nocardia elegans]|uniref:Uncharacterized protein n=1 Tax=Nocardia elegans TaxID=300029 RepID=A0ABW6TMD7_9NOCA